MTLQQLSKTCPGCGTQKPPSEFGKDRQKRDGLTARCKVCRRQASAAYNATPEGRRVNRERLRRWQEANPERKAESHRRWREKNPDWSSLNNRKWREANPNAASEYHAKNREKAMERVLRRRKKLRQTSIGPVDLGSLWEAQHGLCGECDEPIDDSLAYPDPLSKSVDHIVPLSRGGTHEQSNLQWTHLVCNLKKGAKPPSIRPPRRPQPKE